jgi:hypothetical protein
VGALGGQRVQATLRAPCVEAAQVGFGVLARGALKASQVGNYGQPQMISDGHMAVGGAGASSVKFVMS